MKCLFESIECEHRNTGGCSRGDCVFAPQDNAESPSHSPQQLKAEIRSLLARYDGYRINDGEKAPGWLLHELRELSAI